MRWATILGVLCAVGCGGASDDANGVVKVEFQRGQSEEDTPLGAPDELAVSLEYGECLLAYYEEHPEMRQDGVEGQEVFDSWLDRLCEPGSGFANCEVISIEQNMEVASPKLTVTYDIQGELEGRQLLVGPFPTSETADCDNGLSATVSFGAVEGLEVEAFDPRRAVVNQGGSIEIAAR
jgi:hypothetical protein